LWLEMKMVLRQAPGRRRAAVVRHPERLSVILSTELSSRAVICHPEQLFVIPSSYLSSRAQRGICSSCAAPAADCRSGRCAQDDGARLALTGRAPRGDPAPPDAPPVTAL